MISYTPISKLAILKQICRLIKCLFGYHNYVVDILETPNNVNWDGRFICTVCAKILYYRETKRFKGK